MVADAARLVGVVSPPGPQHAGMDGLAGDVIAPDASPDTLDRFAREREELARLLGGPARLTMAVWRSREAGADEAAVAPRGAPGHAARLQHDHALCRARPGSSAVDSPASPPPTTQTSVSISPSSAGTQRRRDWPCAHSSCRYVRLFILRPIEIGGSHSMSCPALSRASHVRRTVDRQVKPGDDSHSCLAISRRQNHAAPRTHASFTTSLPKFSPLSRPMKASGAFSMPSTIVSRYLSLPFSAEIAELLQRLGPQLHGGPSR